MRNKETNFPNQTTSKFGGRPMAKGVYASKRSDGTTNTHPQERMRASANQDEF